MHGAALLGSLLKGQVKKKKGQNRKETTSKKPDGSSSLRPPRPRPAAPHGPAAPPAPRRGKCTGSAPGAAPGAALLSDAKQNKKKI